MTSSSALSWRLSRLGRRSRSERSSAGTSSAGASPSALSSAAGCSASGLLRDRLLSDRLLRSGLLRSGLVGRGLLAGGVLLRGRLRRVLRGLLGLAGAALRHQVLHALDLGADGLALASLVLRRAGLRLLGQVVALLGHQLGTSIGSGFCAACGWSGPEYTFSLRSCARPSRLRGSIPFTASRITSSGRRASISSSVRLRRPPG